MEKKVINDIIDELNNIITFSEDKINGIKIDENNFKKIYDKKVNKKICFVDGGNQEIIGSSNFSLQFIRVCYNIFLDKKIDSKKYEFFILINSINEDNNIKYKTKIFGDFKELELVFDSFDNTLTGIKRAKIKDIGNVIRRFAELKVASLIDVKDSVIVLDGDLESEITYEKIFLKELFRKVKDNNILLGLSKTTDLFTDNANSIAAVLNNIGKESWYYKISENIYFTKLHSDSKYVFRLDLYNFDEDIFPLLLNNSKDPVFIGYPYGLIDAHNFSKVPNNEKEYLKLKIISNLKIQLHLNAANAHNILDGLAL